MTFHLRTNGSTVPFYTRETTCQVMKKKGIVRFDVHGDSFMRHLTQALLLVFSGDLESGSLSERGKQFKECAGDRQFDEKSCFVNTTGINGTKMWRDTTWKCGFCRGWRVWRPRRLCGCVQHHQVSRAPPSFGSLIDDLRRRALVPHSEPAQSSANSTSLSRLNST